MKTELLDRLRARLVNDPFLRTKRRKQIPGKEYISFVTADLFIPMYQNNIFHVEKNKEKFDNYVEDDIIKFMRQINTIRNCLWHNGLRRKFKHCTPEEIADDKLRTLSKQIEKTPELEKIIERWL